MNGRRRTDRFAAPTVGQERALPWPDAAGVWDGTPVLGKHVAGVDEAGRGSLAGPVVAAAVILPPVASLPGLTDSKLLRPAARDHLAEAIRAQAVAYAVATVEASEIDATDILQATLRAMATAVSELAPQPDMVLVDGNVLPPLALPARAVIRGDQLIPAISAASILAKVTRDSIMDGWAVRFPIYGFAQHKGYGTAGHLDCIVLYGPCAIHRRSFAGVREHVGWPDAQGSLW
jgi:ribonuclease HII